MSTKFEEAADAIVSGDIDTLRSLLDENPELIPEKSTREHRCTLLHYVGANGFEGFRQKSPKNAVEIAEILIERGADVDAVTSGEMGVGTTLGLVATSVDPHRAGVQIPLLELLIKQGASLEGLPGKWNPLLAAEIDFVPVIEMLLAAGARPDVYPGMKERVEQILGRPIQTRGDKND